MPLFSVIIATRNRPGLFGRALASVIGQSCESVEFIVVNDGSDEAHLAEYRAIVDATSRPVQFHSLVRRPNGHGAGYARNFGAALATGDYLTFLDDDDCWIDLDYLMRINATITTNAPDLVFSAQAAYSGHARAAGPIWLENLPATLERAGRRPDADGFYRLSVEDTLMAGRFCHLNTMVIRRDLFETVGGIDETIRWEEDRDLYLRLIDRAEIILLSPALVARHNIPDQGRADSVTAAMTEIERRHNQLRVFDKAALFAAHPAIRAHGRLYKGYTLKRIAGALAERTYYRSASFYAREALGAAPTFKWAGYCAYLTIFKAPASL